MELKDILGLSAMVLFFGGIFTAICFSHTAQKKKVATLLLEANDKKTITYLVQETIPYDLFEWHLEKKQKTPKGRFGITKYEYVRGLSARSTGKIIVKVDGRLLLEDTLTFMNQPETGQAYYGDDAVGAKGVQRGCLYSGNVVSIEFSSLDDAFDAEVYFCTSVKAKLMGYKQSP